MKRRTEPVDAPFRGRRPIRLAITGAAILASALVGLGLFGGRMLVADEPLPARADAAIVLWGSSAGTPARLEAALDLLERGNVEHVLFSVGAVESWGLWLPDVVRDYVGREYGEAVAARVTVCDGIADSTLQEAAYLQKCLARRNWETVVVVTSDFHTRRARLIWRATLETTLPGLEFTMHGVADGSYSADGWWRRRRYAKTWLLETAKLAWWMIESWTLD